jgi:hypothetical protein
VKPLVGDIYNGMDVLTREVPWTRIKASGSASSTSTNGSSSLSTKTSVRLQVNVRVANPNLWLANQLGLINPVQWINEGIPFSFVIDWFSNLSQIIMQMTDLVGLEIERPVNTSKSVATRSVYDSYLGASSNQRTIILRGSTIPTAKLRFAYERFQWQRGANAISLLVGLARAGK